MRSCLVRDEGCLVRDEGCLVRDEGCLVRDEGCLVRDEGCLVRGEELSGTVRSCLSAYLVATGTVQGVSIQQGVRLTSRPAEDRHGDML